MNLPTYDNLIKTPAFSEKINDIKVYLKKKKKIAI